MYHWCDPPATFTPPTFEAQSYQLASATKVITVPVFTYVTSPPGGFCTHSYLITIPAAIENYIVFDWDRTLTLAQTSDAPAGTYAIIVSVKDT